MAAMASGATVLLALTVASASAGGVPVAGAPLIPRSGSGSTLVIGCRSPREARGRSLGERGPARACAASSRGVAAASLAALAGRVVVTCRFGPGALFRVLFDPIIAIVVLLLAAVRQLLEGQVEFAFLKVG